MIGISIFDFTRLTAISTGLILCGFAADVSLTGGDKLTGDLVEMDSSGTIKLDSPASRKPILINADRVKSVNFGIEESDKIVSDQRVKLINGDVLPVRVDSLDDTMMLVDSADFGNFSIPREFVDSISLGIVPERVVFLGKDSSDGWTRDSSGSRNWEIKGDRYLARGRGMISRDIDLPEKFILRFKLNWEAQPNFRIFFAGLSKSPAEMANRYILQFTGSGFEIRRDATGNSRYTPIVVLGRIQEQFPGNTLKVEIRVDRSNGDIHLYLNGQLEGRYTDPIPDRPAGGHIALISQAHKDSEQQVSKFEILEWDVRADRHRSEERGDPKSDSLIGRLGERSGGKLTDIRMGENGTVYFFKSDYMEDVIKLPEQEVSTVFFASENKGTRKDTVEDLILRLRGGGEMQVSTCAFGEKIVNLVHPLLGEMELIRDGVTSLERRKIPKAEPVKDR